MSPAIQSLQQRIQEGRASAQRLADLRQLRQIAKGSHPQHMSPEVFSLMEKALKQYPDDPDVVQAVEEAADAQSAALLASLRGY